MSAKLQIALDKSKENIVSIYQVKTGLDCECFCPNPDCGASLEAKNNGKSADGFLEDGQRIAHFAHHNKKECANASESALHLLAKEVLTKNKKLKIPQVFFQSKILSESKMICFDEVEIEYKGFLKENGYQPDALLIKNGSKLLVEFYKSNRKNIFDIEKIKNLNISCIEINVNPVEAIVDGELNRKGMQAFLENSPAYRYWLHNTRETELHQKMVEEAEQLELLSKEKIKRENEIREKKLEDSLNRLELLAQLSIQQEKRMQSEGYQLIKVYKKSYYAYDENYNERTNRMSYHKSHEITYENIYCPAKPKESNRIEYVECLGCKYHGDSIEYFDETKVACGFKNNIENK